jgi:hypothetical protein
MSDQDIFAQLTAMFGGWQESNGQSREDSLNESKAARKASSANASLQAKTQTSIAKLQAKTQLKLQDKSDEAALERLQAELMTRLQITDKEAASAMARLESELGFRREDLAQRLLESRERLGFDREKLTAEIGIERDKLGLAREEMERIGIPKMLADKWFQEKQVEIAFEQIQVDREKIGVERGRLGYDVFSKAVDMASTPAKYFQFGDFASGIASNSEAVDWLNELNNQAAWAGWGAQSAAGSGFGPSQDIAAQGNQAIDPMTAMGQMLNFMGVTAPSHGTAAYQTQYDVTPWTAANQAQAEAMQAAGQWPPGGLAPSQITGGVPVGTPGTHGAPAVGVNLGAGLPNNPAMADFMSKQAVELNAVNDIAKRGGSAMAPGTLERLNATNPDALAKFTSGIQKLRYDAPGWLRDYQRAGVYQGNPEQLQAA